MRKRKYMMEDEEAFGPNGMTDEDLGWGPDGEDADECVDYEY